MTKTTLKTMVLVGSARDVVPPWGGDSRLCDRVLKHVLKQLDGRSSRFGEITVAHEVTVVDPLVEFGAGTTLCPLPVCFCYHCS